MLGLQGVLLGNRVDLRNQIAFFHFIPHFDVKLFDLARSLRTHSHFLRRAHRACGIHRHGQVATGHGFGDVIHFFLFVKPQKISGQSQSQYHDGHDEPFDFFIHR